MTNPARTDMPVCSHESRFEYQRQSAEDLEQAIERGAHPPSDLEYWKDDLDLLARRMFRAGWDAAAARAKRARKEQGW